LTKFSKVFVGEGEEAGEGGGGRDMIGKIEG